MLPDNELVKERLKKLEEIRQAKINPYPYTYDVSATSAHIHTKYHALKQEEHTKESYTVAGRLVGLRRMGKVTFAHILDGSGKLQLYLQHDSLGAEKYTFLKKCDMGDFIGAEGTVFRTKTGDLTVHVKDFTLLAKAVRPLPEKFHGLADPELRYRKRYLDLITNPDVKKVFEQRSKIIQSVRDTLNKHLFLEVETPALQPIYGGAFARPFKSKLNALDMDVYLRIAPELYLKRLLVGGFERVYDIAKNFRNEGVDKSHNPEFTMMECYWAYVDYHQMMKLTEEIYANAVHAVHGKYEIEYQGQMLNFKPPWPRMTMKDSIIKYGSIDVDKLSVEELAQQCRAFAIDMQGDQTKGIMTELLFEELVEKKLVGPIFIIDYPVESSPLCKPKRDNPELLERFEAFVVGMEIGNSFSELNDPILQRRFLEEQAASLRALKGEAHPMDEDFIESIEQGMPPAGGLGLGIDRMVMLITNQPSIRDVILFPFMKVEQHKEHEAGCVIKPEAVKEGKK